MVLSLCGSPPPVEAGQQEGRKAHHEIHGFLAKVAHAEIVVGLRPHFLQGDELGCREVVQVHLRMSTYSATARTMAIGVGRLRASILGGNQAGFGPYFAMCAGICS